eukprot:scaffold334_cov241-Pinguiococcus_pyrenoidosus.AAC.31
MKSRNAFDNLLLLSLPRSRFSCASARELPFLFPSPSDAKRRLLLKEDLLAQIEGQKIGDERCDDAHANWIRATKHPRRHESDRGDDSAKEAAEDDEHESKGEENQRGDRDDHGDDADGRQRGRQVQQKLRPGHGGYLVVDGHRERAEAIQAFLNGGIVRSGKQSGAVRHDAHIAPDAPKLRIRYGGGSRRVRERQLQLSRSGSAVRGNEGEPASALRDSPLRRSDPAAAHDLIRADRILPHETFSRNDRASSEAPYLIHDQDGDLIRGAHALELEGLIVGRIQTGLPHSGRRLGVAGANLGRCPRLSD